MDYCFIGCTGRTSGRLIIIRTALISGISQADGGGSDIYMAGAEEPFEVVEMQGDVVDAIKKAVAPEDSPQS